MRLLARLAGGPLRDASFPPERRAELSGEALRLARELGDDATLAYALECYILARHAPSFTPEQLACTTELVEVASRAGDKERLLNAHDDRFAALLELGELDRARLELDAMERLAAELRQPVTDWVVITELAVMALLEGHLDEAELYIGRAYEAGRRSLAWNASVAERLQLYTLRWLQGRLSEIEDLVRDSVTDYPTYRIWRAVFVHMATELGHTDEARRALDEMAADDFATLPFDETWIVSMCLLGRAAATLGEDAHATAVYQRLRDYDGRIAVAYPEITIGSAAHYLGAMAATMERWTDAVAHFELGLETNATDRRPPLARTDAARLRPRAGHQGRAGRPGAGFPARLRGGRDGGRARNGGSYVVIPLN